jgi:hypothetical protein
MSFDRDTRNKLARMVGEARRRLVGDVTDSLRRLGLQDDGTLVPLTALSGLSDAGKVASEVLRDLLTHFAAQDAAAAEAARAQAAHARMVREIGFTTLNRLVALRMAEERGLIVESVRNGFSAAGFQLFERIANGSLGTRAEAYRAYLECLYDELAVDLPSLFSRTSPESIVFPSESVLEQVLGLLNDPFLVELWKEDETIGWVYQYYNDPDERRRMREFTAPQNSRELAVRNQFFTPRYVVEFLTDNTLGRTWFEMRQGDTRLCDVCRYLVRRPTEVFLQDGESAPDLSDNGVDLSQEELLKQPAYVPFRARKDPRDLKILDPACGSAHFLLYAFDLLETIYQEAWSDDSSPRSDVTGRTLRDDYADADELRRAVPGLILRHNLHGVDIDPRAVQIAGLALWLRAQWSYQTLGLVGAARPRLTKGNVVVAEPMPGERDLLEQFVTRLDPPLIGGLVQLVFTKMLLAGEAGTLLKIEDDLRDAISSAKAVWQRGPQPQQLALMPNHVRARPEQATLDLDTSGISDSTFWVQVEGLVAGSLQQFASEARSSDATRRRLFAEDAERGFGFIDLIRQRFDVVLMNPPFGEATPNIKPFLAAEYKDCTNDIDAAFVSRGLGLLRPGGYLGPIVTRTQFFKASLANWRSQSLLGQSALDTAADLGFGVLDAALVETIAYCSRKCPANNRRISVFRELRSNNKAEALEADVSKTAVGHVPDNCFYPHQSDFSALPDCKIVYQITPDIRNVFARFGKFDPTLGESRVGIQTSDNFRFLRLAWEVPVTSIGSSRSDFESEDTNAKWAFLSKGGEYRPYLADLHLLVNARRGFQEIISFVNQRYPYLNGSADRMLHADPAFYYKAGITYTERTTSGFSPRLLPVGCVANVAGPVLEPRVPSAAGAWVALLMSRVAAYLIELLAESADAVSSGSAARHYMTLIDRVPVPILDQQAQDELNHIFSEIWAIRSAQESLEETSRLFFSPFGRQHEWDRSSFRETVNRIEDWKEEGNVNIVQLAGRAEVFARRVYGLTEGTQKLIDEEFGIHPGELQRQPLSDDQEQLLASSWRMSEEKLVDHLSSISGYSRALTKKTYFADRRLELFALITQCSPSSVAKSRRRLRLLRPEVSKVLACAVVSYCVGCAYGRWNILRVHEQHVRVDNPDPFAAPVGIVPAQLEDPDVDRIHASRRAAAPERSIGRLPASAQSLFVLDSGHADDLVARVREALRQVWGPQVENVERELMDCIGDRDLVDYLGRSSGFFADHLAQYSRSRRKAPIYWPLSTQSGSYTIWLYYPHLNSDTVFTAVNRYVEPKMGDVERQLREARKAHVGATGREASRLLARVEELTIFHGELTGLRDELKRITELPYRPNLDDGVIINAAPLHKLFRLPKWAKDTREVWQKLERGHYDWAHLAYIIWPERVREKCSSDRSLAIAHDLERLYSGPPRGTARKERGRAADMTEDEDDK